MKLQWTGVLIATLTLGLTACGGVTAGKDNSDANLGETSGKARAVIDDFLANHNNAEEIPAQKFSADDTKRMLEQIQVKPAECNTALNAQQNPELMRDAVWAGATNVDVKTGGAASVSVAQLPASGKETAEHSRAMVQQCPQITLGTGEQKTTATMKLLDAPSVQGAERAYLVEASVDLAGSKQVSYSGYAASGNLLIAVTLSEQGSAAEANVAEKLLADAVAAAS